MTHRYGHKSDGHSNPMDNINETHDEPWEKEPANLLEVQTNVNEGKRMGRETGL